MRGPTLAVMAAGIGSRYGGLKQVDPVGPNGEIIIDYSVYDALRAGFSRVVFVIKEENADLFRERIGRHVERRAETAYVYQRLDDLPAGFDVPPDRRKPWGTGHAALSCRDAIDSPFALINADDFYGPAAYRLLHAHLSRLERTREEYCMVGYVLENTLTEHGHVARGVCAVGPEGYLAGIKEHTRIERCEGCIRYTEDGEHWRGIPGDSIVSMNIWGFTPRIFSQLEAAFPRFLTARQDDLDKAEFFLPDVVGGLIEKGETRVRVLTTAERWVGVTYQQDKPAVRQAVTDMIRRGLYPHNLWDTSG